MKHKKLIVILLSFFVLVALGAIFALLGYFNLISFAPLKFRILEPKGLIASGELSLMIKAVLLMLIAVVPAMIGIYYFAFKYKKENNSEYEPNRPTEAKLEFVIWVLPCLVIFIMALLVYKGAHRLDPMKPIASEVKPLKIQVVALRWKWLFIYPEQDIATLNFVEFPANTPLEFELTADAPMNSFWIPQLGGQMYAMTGMVNHLHLIANEVGEYDGSTAEMSGEGFAAMRFKAKAVSNSDFKKWVESVHGSPDMLMKTDYKKLAEPGTIDHPVLYNMVETGMYDSIIMKYMHP